MDKHLFSIVPMRFLIDEAYLRRFAVSALSFPYQRACDKFRDAMKLLHVHNKNSNDYVDAAPYRRLNATMTAMAPTIAHAFERYWNSETHQLERKMLVASTDTSHRPTLEHISDLTYEWGNLWAQHSFKQEIAGIGKHAYQQFLEQLQQQTSTWDEIDAASLLRHLDSGIRLGYNAIPSVIATLFVERESTIHNHTVKWRLAQENGGGLAVVSSPFTYRYQDPATEKEKEGTFAYKLEFHLQTQVGSPHHWLHVYVRCRRYIDDEVTHTNWGRDVSIMVGIERPRLTGWDVSPTLVRLRLTGGHTHPRWLDDPAELLSAMKARNLIKPEQLLKNPRHYRKASADSGFDEYYVIHSEGIKPSHDVKTGFDFAELREVTTAVGNILGLEPSLGQTLAPDEDAYLTRLSRPFSMYTSSSMHSKQFIKKRPDEIKEQNQRENNLVRQDLLTQALQRATQGHTVTILLCWSDDATRKTLLQEIRYALFLNEDDPFPDYIHIVEPPEPITGDLLTPLDAGTLNPKGLYIKYASSYERKKFQKQWQAQMNRAFQNKTELWKGYLKRVLPTWQGYGLVLVELRSLDIKQYDDAQDNKGAIRQACNMLGLASQMLYPIQQKQDGSISNAHKYRMRNAVTDLLYRQTGMVYDLPSLLYKEAKVPQDIVERLDTVALYNLYSSKYKVNYPMAVRLRSSGQMQALLPQHSDEWLSLLDARTLLGKIFARGKPENILLSDDARTQFAAKVFLQESINPTLILLEAVSWRGYKVLPQFSNRNTLIDQLDLKHVKGVQHLYSTRELSHLRIIRLRTIGTLGETPQYLTIGEPEWDVSKVSKDLDYLAGFVDTQTKSDFFHYLSIGQLPVTAKDQSQSRGAYKTDRGGGIAFKHQTIVEFVPFFLQPEDKPLAWCRIPHFMRISPAWDGGNIVLPYPMHVAKSMLIDQLCMLEHKGNWEEM